MESVADFVRNTHTTPLLDTKTEEFTVYARLADDLIERATKAQLADVARLLALNIGWYHQRYGDVPQEELVGMVRADSLDANPRALLLHRLGSCGGHGRR